jgi:hypothetical protein
MMKSAVKEIEKTIDEQQSYLISIKDGIMEGISEGVKEGIVDGLTSGVKDGLKDCFTKGFVNIGQEDLKDILSDIPERIVDRSVTERAKDILKTSMEDYLESVCQKLVDGIRKKHITIPKEKPGYVLGFIKKREGAVIEGMIQRLPNNPIFRELASAMHTAVEETLEEKYESWEKRIQKEAAEES